jgi:murein L,D-transpeptidase YcbB/YkuD
VQSLLILIKKKAFKYAAMTKIKIIQKTLLNGMLLFALTFLIIECGNTGVKKANINYTPKDTTITDSASFSELILDSTKLEKYIIDNKLDKASAMNMRNFYNSRNYHFAWFTTDGLAEQTRAFWNLHNNYVRTTRDSSIYDKKLHDEMEALINEDEMPKYSPDEITEIELHLTQHFFKYAHYAYEGKIDPSQLQWHIPRKKVNALALLDSLVANKGQQLEEWEPVNSDYQQLKKQLPHYYEIEKTGGWLPLNLNRKIYRMGDTAEAIARLKKRLNLEGDYKPSEASDVFTKELEDAVKQAQKRFGVKADGILSPSLVAELNVPVKYRIEQMLVNLERMRWMPRVEGGVRLVANIPEFKLHVYDGQNELFNMKIVVGKAVHNTVVFNDEAEYVIFSPYWNVPASIVRKEILPAIRRNRNYLARNNMEQTGTLNGLPVIRQRPGDDNIYFHDTPAKSLFEQEKRAFSHGCIRLEQPKKLAEFLLLNDKEWTDAKIFDAMHSGSEIWVKLKEKIPVYILYYTSWVDNDGLVNFRDDIYGHDKKMMKRMFTK